MENSTRQFVLTRLSTLLEIPETDTICINLEKSILNYSSDRAIVLREEPAWDNHKYTNIYKHKFLQLQYNLKNSPVLKNWILNRKVKSLDVIEMRPEDLWPDGPYAKRLKRKSIKIYERII